MIHLAELIREYVIEHIPSCKFGLENYSRSDFNLVVWTGKDDYAEGLSVGIITQDTFYISLPNKKTVWLDAYAPDSLDVICRLIRQKIASRLLFERKLDQLYPLTKTKRANPHFPYRIMSRRSLSATYRATHF